MNRSSLPLLVALGLGLVIAPAHAQWKWRDKSGIVQYSDVPPPPSIADKDILERPAAPVRRAAPAPASAPPAAAPASSAATGADAELEARRKAIDQKAQEEVAARNKAEADKVAAQRAESCQRAQAQMRTLDSGIRLSRVNEKGEREILDDKDRSVEMQRARNTIASDCGKAP